MLKRPPVSLGLALALLLLPVALHAEDQNPGCLHEGRPGETVSGVVKFERFADPKHPGTIVSGYKIALTDWGCYEFSSENGKSQNFDPQLTEIALIGWDNRTPSLKGLLGQTVNVTGTMQTMLGLRYVVIPQIAVQSIERCEVTPRSSDIAKCTSEKSTP